MSAPKQERKPARIRLTGAQLELLHTLPSTCSDQYRPAIALVSLGLAEWAPGRFADTLDPTAAGTAYLDHTNSLAGSQ